MDHRKLAFWRSLNKQELLSVIIGVVSTAGLWILASKDDDSLKRVEFLLGFSISLLVPIFVLQLTRGAQFRQIRYQLANVSDSEAATRLSASISIKLLGDALTLAGYNASLKNVGRASADSALHKVVIYSIKEKVSAYGRDLAFECYAHFWEEVVRLQAGSEEPLIACMTHSSDILQWQDDYTKEIGPLHATFARGGGIALRVLINREPRGEEGSLKDYIAFLDQIEKDGAYGVYVNMETLEANNPPSNYLLADFCVLSPERLVARWELTSHGEAKRFTLVKDDKKFRGHTREWDTIVASLFQADYREDTTDPVQLERLEHHRRRFKTAMPAWEVLGDYSI